MGGVIESWIDILFESTCIVNVPILQDSDKD